MQSREFLLRVQDILAEIVVVEQTIADLEVVEPGIPWHQIRGMRNRVIHEYFRVDVEMIWETVRSDLPGLKEALQKILARYG